MHNGDEGESTYPKRAQQLVKKNRAFWMNPSTIRMYDERKDFKMENILNNSVDTDKIQVETQIMDSNNLKEKATDKELMDIAVKRVTEKNTFMKNILDFSLLTLVLLLLVATDYDPDRFLVAIIYFLFWAVRLGFRGAKLMKRNPNKSLKQYFDNKREMSIMLEYEMLSKENNKE